MNQIGLLPLAAELHTYASLLLKFFNEAIDLRLREQGVVISSLQYGLMLMLHFEELTISEISRRMGVGPSTLVRSVDALERKGFAQRGHDPRDRRRHPIRLTAKGRELMRAVPTIAEGDHVLQALGSLGAEGALQLRDALRSLVGQFPEGRMVLDAMPLPIERR